MSRAQARRPRRRSGLAMAAWLLVAAMTPAAAQAPAGAPARPALSASPAVEPWTFPPQVRAPGEAELAAFRDALTKLNEAQARRDLDEARRQTAAALAVLDQSMGPNHPLRAVVAARAASTLHDLGALDEAGALFEQALTTLDTWPVYDPVVNDVVVRYVPLLLDRDVPISTWSRHLALQVLVADAVFPPLSGDDLATANYLDAAGLVAAAQQYHEEAETKRRRVLAIREQRLPAGHLDIGVAQARLAATLADLGKIDEAEKLANQAQAIFDAQAQASPGASVIALTALAKVRALRGRPDEAEALFRRALDLRRSSLGAEHPRTRDAMAELARFLKAQRRDAEADPLLLDLMVKAAASRQFGVRALRSSLDWADTLVAADDCRKTAEQLGPLRDGLRNAMPSDISPLFEMRVSETYGRLLACSGRPKDAAQAFRDAFMRFLAAQSAKNSSELSLALARFALVLSAHPATASDAVWFSRQAVGIARSRRRQGLSGTDAPAFESAVDRAVHSVGGGSPLATAFEADLMANWSERAQGGIQVSANELDGFLAAQEVEVSGAARALAQTTARTATGDDALADLARQQQNLSAEAVALDREALAARARGDAARAAAVLAQLDALGQRLEQVDARLARDFPGYAELVSPRPLAIAEVQSRLADDEGLLLIVPARDDIHVFAVSKSKLAWHRLPAGAAATAQRVARLRCQVDPATCGSAGAAGDRGVQSVFGQATAQGGRRFDRDAAYALYRDLVAPVEGALAGVDRLFVTSAGALAKLPLSLLVTEAPRAGEDDADPALLARTAWLGDRYALVTLPSVSALQPATAAAASPSGPGFVGYGAPVLLGAAGASRGGGTARLFGGSDARGLPLANVEAIRRLAPLPGSQRELEAMARLFGADAQVRLGAQATEADLKRLPSLGRARVLAFATHGLLPREVRGMDEPGLVLTPPAQASALDDGVLTASEAAGLKLSAEWIILSACNTAAEDGSSGAESLSGLAKSFLYAGAESLLASHWRVADDATAMLTTETLALRQANPALSRAQALQSAMRAVRTGRRGDGTALPGWTPAWAHPAAWAPFVLIAGRDR